MAWLCRDLRFFFSPYAAMARHSSLTSTRHLEQSIGREIAWRVFLYFATAKEVSQISIKAILHRSTFLARPASHILPASQAI